MGRRPVRSQDACLAPLPSQSSTKKFEKGHKLDTVAFCGRSILVERKWLAAPPPRATDFASGVLRNDCKPLKTVTPIGREIRPEGYGEEAHGLYVVDSKRW